MSRLRVIGPPIVRFMARVRVDEVTNCWLWLGALSEDGYGRFSVSHTRRDRAHRFAYEHFVGPIPEGLTLDHLCRNRRCVNPEHLEPATHRENILRGTGMGARHAAKTHCVNGHAFTPENTCYYGPDDRWRDCLACRRNRRRARKVAA